jgi:hypothetical protein
MCKSFFKLIFFLLSLTSAWAQNQTAVDSVEQPPKIRLAKDTVKNKYLPSGLRIGTDLLAIVRSKDPSFKGWEINFDTDFNRYYFVLDYGYWSTNQILENGRYQNEGYYFRLGTDINFLLKDPDRNMFFLGFRYGLSNFNDKLEYQYVPNKSFTSFSNNLGNGSVSGSWVEITTGLRVKIAGGLWMGYTARLKFAPSISDYGDLISYDMPGYGIVSETPYWGFNYQIFWRFGWRTPPPIKPKN